MGVGEYGGGGTQSVNEGGQRRREALPSTRSGKLVDKRTLDRQKKAGWIIHNNRHTGVVSIGSVHTAGHAMFMAQVNAACACARKGA